VARWERRICLNAEGVSAAQRDFFTARIAAVAREIGLEVVADRDCAPSAYLVFTGEPARLLAGLRRTRPFFFGATDAGERESFLASQAPVRWLSHAALRGADGETPFSFYVDPKSGGVERPVPGMRGIGSRLASGARMDLQAMLVLVDSAQLAGVSNGALADYLAMVVLGNVRQPPGALAQPSILRLFERPRESAASAELTAWDLAYLRSLHAGNWNMAAARRRDRIQASMARDLGAR
jgi:hypothetical protein